MNEQEKAQLMIGRIRQALFDFLEEHRLVCIRGAACVEAENVIAYLCHSLAIRGPRLLKVNELLLDFDRTCPGCEACMAHKVAAHAGRGLSAGNN